jgi:hypothetical protein
MARTITARRADTCRAATCRRELAGGDASRAIAAGERINYGGPGAVTHAGCEAIDAAPRSSSRRGRRTGYRSSNHRTGRGAWGRCEDAPCCGCCD